MTSNDVFQFHIDAVNDNLRRIFSVKAMCFTPHQIPELPLGIFDGGGEQALGQRAEIIHPTGNGSRIFNDHLAGRLFAQIREFRQHFLGGTEIQGIFAVRIVKLLGGQQNMTVDLVLRLEEVDVSGGTHRLAQPPADLHDFSVKVPQVLHAPGNGFPFLIRTEHIGIVGQGLDFQVVVPGRNAVQFPIILSVYNGPEQLAGFACGADDEAFPVLVDQRFRHNGKTVEMIQVAFGHQLIEVSKAGLVFRQQNQMVVGTAAAAAALHPGKNPVDLAHTVCAHLAEQRNQFPEDKPADIGIIKGTMMVERRQLQPVCHRIQLVIAQLGTEILGQQHGVHIERIKRPPGTGAILPNESDVKLRVMSHQRPVPCPVKECVHRIGRTGCTLQHLVGDAGEGDGLGAKRMARMGKGRKLVHCHTILHQYRTDLNDLIGTLVKAGGLNVKGDVFFREFHITQTVHRNPLVHVVLIVCLHTVENLDFLSLARGVIGVREGLKNTVVGNGNGRMTPTDRLFDHFFGVGQCVHHGHFSMQMQLNSLFRGVVTPTFRLWQLVNAVGFQHHIRFKAAHCEPSLYLNVLADFDGLYDGLGNVSVEKLIDPDRAGVVGHVKADHPRFAPGQLAVFNVEHIAFDEHVSHIQHQIANGNRLLSGADFSVNLLDPNLFSVGSRRCRRGVWDHVFPHGLHFGKQVSPLLCFWKLRDDRLDFRSGFLFRNHTDLG